MRALMLLPFIGLTATAAADSLPPEAVLTRMRQAQADVETLTARLEQIKSYPQLGIDDPAERGRFTMVRGSDGATRVRMEIREPETRVLVLAEGRYLLYQPRIKQAVEGELASGGTKGLFSGILTGSEQALGELERDYVVQTVSESAGAVELRFTAREGASVYCQRIDLWVDLARWLPVKQSCHEANQSVITFELDDIELDVPLGKNVFDVDLPADVEKVRG